MAIIKENFEINGRAFTKTYSNEYRYIVRDGVSYFEASDPSEFGREYAEGDFIEMTDDYYANAGQIILGRNDSDDFNSEDSYTKEDYAEIGKMFLGVDDDDSN